MPCMSPSRWHAVGQSQQQLVASHRVGRSDGPLDLQGAAPERAGLVEGSTPLGGDRGLPPVGRRRPRPRSGRYGAATAWWCATSPSSSGSAHQPLRQSPADHGVPAGPLSGRQVGVDRLPGERVHEPEPPRPVALLHDAGRHRRVDVVEHAVAQGGRQHARVEAASHHRGDAERGPGGLARAGARAVAARRRCRRGPRGARPPRPSPGRWRRAAAPSRGRRTGCRRSAGSAPRPGPAPARGTTSESSSATAAASSGGTGTRRTARRASPPGHGRGAGAAGGRPCARWRRTAPAGRAAPRRRTPAGAGRSGRPSAGPRSARPGGRAARRAAGRPRRRSAASWRRRPPHPGPGSPDRPRPRAGRRPRTARRSRWSRGRAARAATASTAVPGRPRGTGRRPPGRRRSRARWTTSVASMDLPIPASPLISRTPPWPASTRSARASWIADSASARPTTPEARARVVSTAPAGRAERPAAPAGSRPGPSRPGSWASMRCSSSRTEADGSTPSSSTRAARSSRSASRASACRSLR